jgi:hypothetical protein
MAPVVVAAPAEPSGNVLLEDGASGSTWRYTIP